MNGVGGIIVGSFISILFFLIQAWPCEIVRSNGQPVLALNDAFYRTVHPLPRCPENAPALKSVLGHAGGLIQPAMVANRGFHNPELGSFSFFESVRGLAKPGQFFFGHFTSKNPAGEIELDQAFEPGKLLVELLVWDDSKGYYNFYELIGTATGGQWFYRGDSADIFEDNRYLHLNPPSGVAKFGNRLRCSGCHTSGGPIMKELAFPHNDWWRSARPLPLGSGRPSAEVVGWMSDLVDAGEFAANVKAGIDSLEQSRGYRNLKASRRLEERLRPLFCEQEINIESDLGLSGDVTIPTAFERNPLLGSGSVLMSREQYKQKLIESDLRFPETNLRDADHAWLTPVKGYSDLLAIRSLIEDGVVSREYAESVLKVDEANPAFSRVRCELLRGAHGLPVVPFVASLPEDAFAKLLRVRRAVRESEISQNPRGQILEPGFRVIFPVEGAR